MDTLYIRSPEDGSELTFIRQGGILEETEFEVSVRTPWFTGRAGASSFMNGSPSALFESMARDWAGWKGEKKWEDLERRVTLSAKADSTGHVLLNITLTGENYDSSLQVAVKLVAGQLEQLAKETREVLG